MAVRTEEDRIRTLARTMSVARTHEVGVVNAQDYHMAIIAFNFFKAEAEKEAELKDKPEVRDTRNTWLGSQFAAENRATPGRRTVTKIGENKWTDLFHDSGNSYGINDAEAQTIFDERNGRWLGGGI